MVTFLIRLFIHDRENIQSPQVRKQYGFLSGILGICLNLLLFACKFAAGLLCSSISIIADAFNNLSDAGSSIITMIGFRMAAQEADNDHPFGHGRLEYISGLIVSILILLMGAELVRTSIVRILHPQAADFTPYALGILTASILTKLYMYRYNKALSARLDSPALKATAADSLSDSLASFAVLASAIVSQLSGYDIDGWCGVLVGLFILHGGIEAAKDTISPLLGQAPDPDFIQKIKQIVQEYDDVLGIHDLIVHDYGPGRRMISLHAEVPAGGNILALHDTIDRIEKRLQTQLHCSAVIHMDPVMNEDQETLQCRQIVTDIVRQIDDTLSLHDFRIVKGAAYTNLIFDIVVPYKAPYTANELTERIEACLKAEDPSYHAVIQIDQGIL